MDVVSVQEHIGTPKYKQIVNSVESAIAQGELKKGDQLPSLNTIRKAQNVSRDTVIMAFNELKARGIVESVVGKGYYVSSESTALKQRVFLLFDEFNSFKEDLYNAFINELGDNIQVDIFFHHFNFDVFSKLISDNIGDYGYYVIMPANLEGTKSIIDRLPSEKVFILDQTHEELDAFPAVYQNFEKDIYNGLSKCKHLVQNYDKAILVYSESKQPKGILSGFTQFCENLKMPFEVIDSVTKRELSKGDLFVLLEDKSLIRIIKSMKSLGLQLAKDIGVISFNDTLLKEVLEGGITTISTDFNAMGQQLALMLLNKESIKIENPNHVIIRKSL